VDSRTIALRDQELDTQRIAKCHFLGHQFVFIADKVGFWNFRCFHGMKQRMARP
jgi:hypothetical protein